MGPSARELTLSRMDSTLDTLYEEVDRADVAPTLAQVNAVVQSERDFSEVMKRWEEFKTADLVVLNRHLRAAGLPEVRLESKPRPEGE